ncbi:hypothetical protein F4780DRAFT_778002 [Xylariomycetidae sp. FL0641]|nr:hypothetical protein F4780DRAFT_778002 [Xylariomycetidae sp. FL0641]
MTHQPIHDMAKSNVLAWSAQGVCIQHSLEEEASAEVDEPPDRRACNVASETQFRRSTVRKTSEHSESLLTRALHHPDEGTLKFHFNPQSTRRRSMNSSVSIASTADLTSDTGLTSPARTNTPSPPPPVISMARLNTDLFNSKPKSIRFGNSDQTTPKREQAPAANENGPKDSSVEALAKKRCISFACGPKPEAKKPILSPPQVPETKVEVEVKVPRKTCIKFACPAKPAQRKDSPVHEEKPRVTAVSSCDQPARNGSQSPSATRKYRSPSSSRGRAQRSLTPRPAQRRPSSHRSAKYLTANPTDLKSESSHFHEFASDEPREEDWLKENYTACGRLTINDTLRKENEIRKIGKEAEEEALEEEEEEYEQDDLDAEANEDEDEDDEVEDEDEDEVDDGQEEPEVEDVDDDDDGFSGYGTDDDASDGYNTDNEVGFADSDDDDNDRDQFWTPGRSTALNLSGGTPVYRRPSLNGNRSDSSSSSDAPVTDARFVREKSRRIKIRPSTPELPDSTDFVCGTLDEDRELEDEYAKKVAARRKERLHFIPQDIDPSFPTSEPEDEDIEPQRRAHDSDEPLWIHGELEDLHHTDRQDGDRRRRKAGQTSPKRYHSPPPKRHHSPPPKGRGRSPKRLLDRHSPRPAPIRAMQSPPASLVLDGHRGKHEFKSLAFRPGLTHTKSLPRAPGLFPQHLKSHRRPGKAAHNGVHVRGAIDIVKGLEQKRQRRKEKFKEKYLQKHNNKARKGQVDNRPQPGKGAQRMREIGLLSAGKLGPDQFVLSI